MKPPLVSICIPNYNNAKYLDDCIKSALSQRYENIEVIFVDDNSSDDSLSIAQKYAGKIKIFTNNTNLGQPKNTNKCVKISNGQYFVILHSDDILLPDFIQKLMAILKNFPNVGIAVGERMETNETGIPQKIVPFYDRNCIIPGEKQAKVFMMSSFLPCQVLICREIFEKTGWINEHHIVNLDGLMWFKMALVSDVGYIRDAVSIYRIHGNQTTAKYNRTINHMIEYYGTLCEMFKLAKGRPYLEQFFDEAVRRVGVLTLRYCHSVFKEKNFDLVKRYLLLAAVFDPEIVHSHQYRTLKYCAESIDVDPLELYEKLFDGRSLSRKFSYSPPDGFESLNIPQRKE